MQVINVHMSNVFGLGAQKFVKSIFDELTSNPDVKINKVYINPQLTINSNFKYTKIIYRNYYFGIFSRVLEIFFFFYILQLKRKNFSFRRFTILNQCKAICVLSPIINFRKISEVVF